MWISTFAYYIYSIARNEMEVKKKRYFIFVFYYIVLAVILWFLPIDCVIENNFATRYTTGMSVFFTYGISAIAMTVIIGLLIIHLKNLKNQKYIPVFLFLIIGGVAIVVQIFNPQLLLMTYVETFICVIMYFTIENPDIKLMNQIALAKDHAEKANRAKSDFLSSMSHEIRTPLNAIVGFSEMIEYETEIEACKEDARDIIMASHNLLEIVNGILDISKIEANKMEIINKDYSLVSELENLSKLMIPRIGEKPIELVTNFAPDIPPTLHGDIGKIKQILTNLLTNAIKYTDAGRIDFKVKCVNDKNKCKLMFSVSDTGRGIKNEMIHSLFTKFNRLDEDKNSTIEGTGLGLAITKSLVEMMGGKIVVQSEYGIGSNFTVYLPQRITYTNYELEVNKIEENYNFSGYKVLIVDDNRLNLKVADKLLKKYKIDTTLVESGIECIKLIQSNKNFDLILMDDMMPKLKGTETLLKLKEMSDFHIKTVVLTANAFTGIREKYIQDGFDDYLSKPIEKTELLNILSKHLTKKDCSKNIVSNAVTVEMQVKEKYLNRKILIIDDNKLNIKVAYRILKPYGFLIEEVYSGKDGIEKVKNNRYDLIFMDYMMPEMDGIEALKNLKTLPNFKTPVVVLTADSVEGAREKFLRAGFDEYIAKPINKDVLDEVLAKIFRGQEF